MVCIENGANVAKFHDAASSTFRKSILSIGRFATNKRIDLLIDFVRELRRHDPEWTLTIAGRPGDLTVADVSSLIDRAGLRGAVEIVASPTDGTVKALMKSCSFLASASDYEGFGLTAIEGMSAGLIPLLSDIPPFRRLVANTGLGMIIDYTASDTGARSLLQGLDGIAADYAEERAACMQAAATFDWRRVCQDHAKLYEAATGGAVRTVLDVPVGLKPSPKP